jgi:hypothetical protein
MVSATGSEVGADTVVGVSPPPEWIVNVAGMRAFAELCVIGRRSRLEAVLVSRLVEV